MGFPEILDQKLENLAQAGCYRSLSKRQGVDFSSNDYLGFSQDDGLHALVISRLKGVPLGSSASRLLRGHLEIFEETEKGLADFCSRESALLYPSGFQANVGLLSALLSPNDIVYSDQFNHASLIDGIRLSGAKKRVYSHLHLKELRNLLAMEESRHAQLRVIVTESVYGMDGDLAPLTELVDLAEEFDALLIVDEAHATGLWGNFRQNKGGGLVQALGLSHKVFASIHPAGKALGAAGAWVCGDARLKDYLINCSRAQIFSTALSPLVSIVLQSAVQYWKEVGKDRVEILFSRSRTVQNELSPLQRRGITVSTVNGLIIPVIIGENERAVQISEALRKEGLDVRAIRPPTVPAGTARLRLTINWNQTTKDLDHLVWTLDKILS